jgi:hypothetical protein
MQEEAEDKQHLQTHQVELQLQEQLKEQQLQLILVQMREIPLTFHQVQMHETYAATDDANADAIAVNAEADTAVVHDGLPDTDDDEVQIPDGHYSCPVCDEVLAPPLMQTLACGHHLSAAAATTVTVAATTARAGSGVAASRGTGERGTDGRGAGRRGTASSDRSGAVATGGRGGTSGGRSGNH